MSKVTAPAATAPSTQHNSVTIAIGAATGSLQHKQPVALWATPDMDAYAYEAAYDPTRISLADAEASVRAQLAEFGVQVAAFLNEDAPLTAAQRGPEWQALYGCNPECQLDHAGADGEPGWHATAPIETEHRSIDDNFTAAENAQVPLLGAQIAVDNEKSQAYGRRTRVWLHLGNTTGTLTPNQARQALTAIRGFVAEFEAVVALAEKIGAADFEGDPEIARLDREAEDRRIAAVSQGRR
ncbi:hypothetical protein ACH49_22415 [Streptomyces leeuwenhoekii]|uniref:Uncharacterized protein n=1 Tax=Streptomyces leeuwenhoekii TaxID=1437453 RepID=A0ABR5HU90_STRLW|nr:hypothetical protein [Streptomyces leeuwenhoekii]KMS74526.1 hypothetical protein ACH49_22415 [Streptomyces leeuwenhoekii]